MLLLLAMSQMPLDCVEASAGRVCGRACRAPCVGHTGYWALCSQQVWTVPMPGTGACRPLHCSPLYVLRYGVLLLVLEHTHTRLLSETVSLGTVTRDCRERVPLPWDAVRQALLRV